jgi:hypothetical protein
MIDRMHIVPGSYTGDLAEMWSICRMLASAKSAAPCTHCFSPVHGTPLVQQLQQPITPRTTPLMEQLRKAASQLPSRAQADEFLRQFAIRPNDNTISKALARLDAARNSELDWLHVVLEGFVEDLQDALCELTKKRNVHAELERRLKSLEPFPRLVNLTDFSGKMRTGAVNETLLQVQPECFRFR